MFFKREKAATTGFAARIDELKSAGYKVTSRPDARQLVTKSNLAAIIAEGPSGDPVIAETGLLISGEVALLTDLGYQKVFITEAGKRIPAIAEHLSSLHGFREDLGEALGLVSLYNEGLGSTSGKHHYDRVQGR